MSVCVLMYTYVCVLMYMCVSPSEVGGDDVAESDARGVVSHSEMSGAPDVSQPTLVQEQKEDPSL